MNQVPLSRTRAEGRARAAQLTCAAMCLCAIAVIAFALPTITSVPALADVRPPAPTLPTVPSGEASQPEKLIVNAGGISDRFMQFSNRPVQATPPQDPQDSGEEEPTDTPPAPEAPRFVGVIREPGRMLAMVRIDGKQRIMAEGETVSNLKLVRVEPTSIIVEVDGVEKQLEKQARTGGVTSVAVDSANPSVMPEGGVPNRGVPFRGEQGHPEMDARDGIDLPAQINRRPRPALPGVPAGGRRPSNTPNR
jgi:hypothetical protein